MPNIIILSNDACAQLIHSLVTVRLDYSNSILYGLPDNSLYRIQKIQNTAARILACLPRFSHISSILFDLHRFQLGTESRLKFVF